MRPIDFEPIWNNSFPGVSPVMEELRQTHNNGQLQKSLDGSIRYVYWDEGDLRYGLEASIVREQYGLPYKHYLELVLVALRPSPEKLDVVGRQKRYVIPVMDEALVRSAITNMESWVNKK